MVGRDYKVITAYRLYYEEKYGPVPKGKELHHFKCENRRCCNPDHVTPLTRKEHNRLSPRTKRTAEEIRQIRDVVKAQNLRPKDVSKLFNIPYSSVGAIIHNHSWKDI